MPGHRSAVRRYWLAFSLAGLTLAWADGARAGATLEAIRKRDALICGVSTGVAGFSAQTRDGQWVGLDVDVCRAVAAAVLGSPDKLRVVPLNSQQRFAALQSAQVDLLSRNTSWTLTRDASLGLHFAGVTYYDGQGFMVPKKFKLKSARELNGAEICVQSGTTNEKNLADFARQAGIRVKPIVFEGFEAAYQAFFRGRCQAYTTDLSGLAGLRVKQAGRRADDYVILPEVISKEPLGPVVRRGDDDWFAVVKWVVFALVEAEERGVTQANVRQAQHASTDPGIARLLGASQDMGRLLGLRRDWAVQAIAATGNYGEIFERNVGSGSPLQQSRGLNRLWSQGGLMYAMPLR